MENDQETKTKENIQAWMKLLDLMINGYEDRVENDKVNHPAHYQSETGIEAIEVIEAFNLNFNLGNAIKYILRSYKKGAAVEDLQKAMWYLRREKIRLSNEGEENEQR
jgi:hypothetical protein